MSAAIVALCPGSHGLLFVTDKSLYQVSLPNGGAKKICDAPVGCVFQDVAYNPVDRGILLLGFSNQSRSWPVYYLNDKTRTPKGVICRRVNSLTGAVFNREGHLFFTSDSDLWEGEIETGDENEPPAAVATRFGPVALLETQNGTPASTGVREIAVAGDTVYAQMRRMGGSGWGSTISVRWAGAAKRKGEEAVPSLDAGSVAHSVNLYKAALDRFQLYGDNAGESYLCGSTDGRKVFFATHEEEEDNRPNEGVAIRFYLGDETGAVRPLQQLRINPDAR